MASYAFEGVDLDIRGTSENPLFNAEQIGQLLDIQNIRYTIKKFDDDDRVAVDSINTATGRRRAVMFLTEMGLNRVIGMCHAPVARPFQKWVGNIIREIRRQELPNKLAIDDCMVL
jgi:prophage antirepressor-like protein